MANLNIPFLLLDKDECSFKPAVATSTLIHHSQFNLRDPAAAAQLPSEVLRGSSIQGGGGLAMSTRNFTQPIQFDETKQNLLLLADEKTGTMALCSHEQHGCDEQISRMLVNVQPRVLLVPSIMAQNDVVPGPLKSHCIVRCPAAKILNASAFWLCTLHADKRLRLWNTDDGRCVAISPSSLFAHCIKEGEKLVALCAITGFPGHVMLFGDKGTVFVIDAYKMQLNQHLSIDSEGFASCEYFANSSTVAFMDACGTLFLLHDGQHSANNRHKIDEFEPEGDPQLGAGRASYAQNEDPSRRGSSSTRSSRAASQRGGGPSVTCQKKMLKFCGNQRVIQFKFRVVLKAGGRDVVDLKRLSQSQVLAFNYDQRTKSVAIAVYQDRIEQILIGQPGDESPYQVQALKDLTEETMFVSADFIEIPNSGGYQMLLCVDKNCRAFLYDIADLHRPRFELTEEERGQYLFDLVQPVQSFDLLQGCKVTDYHQAWIKEGFVGIVSDHDTKQQYLQGRLDKLKERMVEHHGDLMTANGHKRLPEQQRTKLFKYCFKEHTLYSFIQVQNKSVLQPQRTNLMLSWDLNKLLHEPRNSQPTPSLSISNLSLFTSQSKQGEPPIPNCLINFNSQMTKQFYNSCQFRFFFTDEKVTAKAIFQDNDSPSEVIGTNYGRIFMIPMFQEQQYKHVLPTLLIDSHRGSSITKLYMAYQGSLQQNEDGGGHLLSTSEDGTICVTDLKSEAVASKLYSKGPNQPNTSGKRRTDQFMHEKGKNMRTQRRHSVTQCFSAEDFFKYERVRATEVFDEIAFSQIQHVFRIKTFQEVHEYLTSSRQQSQRSKPQPTLEIPKQYYAFVTVDQELIVLAVHQKQRHQARFQIIKLPLLPARTIGVYLDQASQNLFILSEDLDWLQFSLRSHQLAARKRTAQDALNMLQVPQLVDNLLSRNEKFFRDASLDESNMNAFQNFTIDINKAKILKGLGTHQCLDFLNMSLSMPTQYGPQAHVLKDHTVPLRHLFRMKKHFIGFGENQDCQLEMLRAINHILFWDCDKRMQSDVTRRQTSILAVQTQGSQVCGSDQTVLIAQTQDMLSALQSKMKRVKANRDKGNFANILEAEDRSNPTEESKNASGRPRTEAVKKNNVGMDGRLISTGASQPSQAEDDRRATTKPRAAAVNQQQYGMEKYRWPSKILGLVHPFNLHEGMDESLEEFFNLNMPFLDFRIGIQGIQDAFSFVISKEDRNYHGERDHISKIMGLLKLSRSLKKVQQEIGALAIENLIEQHIDPADSTLYLGRFFNSEYWKVSPYLSTVMPGFLLSSFVSIIEYDEKEICLLSQVWLDIVHHIRHASRYKQSCASPLKSPTALSTSVLSQLLLLQDLNVSSCAKDIIFKPILCHQSEHDKKQLQSEISDWLTLVIDTYEELKQETTSGKPEDQLAGHQSSHHHDSRRGTDHKHAHESSNPAVDILRASMIQGPNSYQGAAGQANLSRSNEIDQNDISQIFVGQGPSGSQDARPLSHFFGELEIKGLINVSFYAFYCQVEMHQHVGKHDLDRVSKLVVILIREVVQQFQDRKDYIHLLTILLYLLQCNLKTAHANFKRKAIMDDVVKLLLHIFNYYKPPLNRELFITRVTSENFNLIRPTNSELYLKLVAAKTLLEIGVSFTEEFLQLIQFHATTLRPSHDHQKNVLETLRYFINGYGENLEKYLIQIVQILLRCLDPNELALRKNSHKYVSVILSNMVKIFPMVAFHYDTQRLAVGTHDGPIGIYDVRTSAKWKILEGHTKNVTCLCFDSKGNYLASYSAIDLTLKLWKVGNTSFFATIMGGTGRFAKQVKLESLGPSVPNPHVHQQQGVNHIEMENRDRRFHENNEVSRGVDDQNAAAGSISQIAGSGGSGGAGHSNANQGNRISRCHIRFLRNDKDVELIREDGSKELHSLIK